MGLRQRASRAASSKRVVLCLIHVLRACCARIDCTYTTVSWEPHGALSALVACAEGSVRVQPAETGGGTCLKSDLVRRYQTGERERARGHRLGTCEVSRIVTLNAV